MDTDFQKYLALLEAVMPIINEHFEMQKDYIKCKVGCSYCCQKGYYPVTKVEAMLMKIGFQKLDETLQKEISEKALNIEKQKKEFLKENDNILKFKYSCPLLIDDKCSIYPYRPIICRTQGLIQQSIKDETAFNMPACVYIGLNYANVWDEDLQAFSSQKIKEQNITIPPVALDFSYESLLQIYGINPDTLVDNIINPDNDEIRMIFEWVITEILNKN